MRGADFCTKLLYYLLRIQAIFKCLNRITLRYVVWWASENNTVREKLQFEINGFVRTVGVRQIALFADTKLEEELCDAVALNRDSVFDYPSEKQDKSQVKRLIHAMKRSDLDDVKTYSAYRRLVSRDRSRIAAYMSNACAADEYVPARLETVFSKVHTQQSRKIMEYISHFCLRNPSKQEVVETVVLTDCEIPAIKGLCWDITSPRVDFCDGKIKGFSPHFLYLLIKYGLYFDIRRTLENELQLLYESMMTVSERYKS